MRIVNANTKDPTVDVDGFSATGTEDAPVDTTLLAMGNHEYFTHDTEKASALFTETTGQALDKVYWVAGKVPVIKVSMISGQYRANFASRHEFIKESLEAIEKTGYEGHIFLITHIAAADTVVGSSSDPFAPETLELLAKYPQVINVSGHSHQVINNPKFIDQSAGFTSITDGVVGEDYDDADPEYLGSGIIVFDVKSDGTTEFHRVDLENGKILYDNEKWVLDSSHTAKDFIYFATPGKTTNPNAYHVKAKAPSFPADAWVKFEEVGDHDSVRVTFTPNAIPATNNNYDYVYRYTVTARSSDGDVVSASVASDEYKPVAKRAKTFTVDLNGLYWNKDYEVSVIAQTAYGNSSKPLTAEGYANIGAYPFGQSIPRPVYDIDYSYGKQADAMGHTLTEGLINKIVFDDSIAQNALYLHGYQTHRYAFGKSDLEAIQNEFTLETYFNISDVQPEQTVIGMRDSCGIEIAVTAGKMKVIVETSKTGDIEPAYDIPVSSGEWVHVTVTYDHKTISLYINGELYTSARFSGGLARTWDDEADENAFFINIGGFKRGSDSETVSQGTLLNCFRLYRGAMDADMVKAAYEKAVAPNAALPFEDVKDSAWYSPSVRYAYENGLMNGTSATAFDPTVETSRAMIVQLLYNMEGRPEVEYKPIFTDVSEKAWYAKAVIWAYENGVTAGSSATTFSPDTLVTREQVAVFLYRFMKDYKGEEMAEGADLSSFPDADKISHYAGFADAVAWANGVGIITGKTSENGAILAPLDRAQRCETATMFARFHRSFAS